MLALLMLVSLLTVFVFRIGGEVLEAGWAFLKEDEAAPQGASSSFKLIHADHTGDQRHADGNAEPNLTEVKLELAVVDGVVELHRRQI